MLVRLRRIVAAVKDAWAEPLLEPEPEPAPVEPVKPIKALRKTKRRAR
jgi:hypothetical protein